MSIINFERLSHHELIQEFVLQMRRQGTILPYEDQEIIAEWIAHCKDIDQLLLVLNEILPAHYTPKASRKSPPSLKRIRKKVLKQLSG